MSIQPAMQRTVEWMRSHGFTTTDSGDGVTNPAAGMSCALEFAHVFCTVAPVAMVSEADRLRRLASAAGIGGKVECSYRPDDGVAILGLLDVVDSDWVQP